MKVGDFSNAGGQYRQITRETAESGNSFANVTDKFQHTPDLPGEVDLKKAAEILTKKTKMEAEKLWSGMTRGYLRSSPFIASDGTIYCNSAGDEIHAFDPVSGDKRWSVGNEKDLKKFKTGVAELPDGSLVAMAKDNRGDTNVYALDPKTGEEKWSFRWDPQWGIPNSFPPQISPDGTLYLNHEFAAIAVDPATREVKTVIEYGGRSSSPPTFSPDGKTVYVNSDSTVIAFDPQTGRRKWQADSVEVRVSGAPVTGKDGTLYCGNFNKELFALDPKTGKKKWMFKTSGSIMAAPAVGSDGTVFAAGFDGKIHAVDPETGNEKWNFKGFGEMRVSPVPGPNGVVCLVSDRNMVYGLDEKTGAKAWEFNAESYVHNPPVFDREGNFYMGCNNDRLYAYSDSYGKMKANPLETLESNQEFSGKPVETLTIKQEKGFVDIGGVKLQIRSGDSDQI